jgi:hypothetical protein
MRTNGRTDMTKPIVAYVILRKRLKEWKYFVAYKEVFSTKQIEKIGQLRAVLGKRSQMCGRMDKCTGRRMSRHSRA